MSSVKNREALFLLSYSFSSLVLTMLENNAAKEKIRDHRIQA